MKLETLLSASRFLPDGTRDYSYNYSYNYDPMGNPLNRTSQGQSRNYTANNLNQLASATGPTSTDVAGKVAPELVAPFNVTVNGQAATVDEKGNWIAQSVPLTQGGNTITVEATDRFARETPSFVRRDGTTEGRRETREVTLMAPPVFTYDPNGNMIGDGSWSYSYNQENRMSSASSTSSALKVENTYDGFGRRRIKKVYENETLTSETHFVYDNLYVIAETDGSGNVLRRYIRNEDQLLAVEDLALEKTFYYLTDGNKNVTELIDSEGTIAAHYEYDPFGRIVKESGSYAATNPFRFSSEYFDKETGLVAYLYRDYSPRYARWLSRDPIEETGGYNLYCFASNDAVNNWDNLGLSDCYEAKSEGVAARDPWELMRWAESESGETDTPEASYSHWAKTDIPFLSKRTTAVCNSGYMSDNSHLKITAKAADIKCGVFDVTCRFHYNAAIRNLNPGTFPSRAIGINYSATVLGNSIKFSRIPQRTKTPTIKSSTLDVAGVYHKQVRLDSSNWTNLFNSWPVLVIGTYEEKTDNWLGAAFDEVYAAECEIKFIRSCQ